MTSSEIRKKIDELVNGLADFNRQVDDTITKYTDAINEIREIESTIGNSQDTLVIKSISNSNGKILEKTTKLIEKIESERNNVVNKINKKIADLIEMEKLAIIEEEKIRERQRRQNLEKQNNVPTNEEK